MTGNFDFSMKDLDFTGTKPKSITFDGKTKVISTNAEIFISVVKYVFELNKEKLFQISKDEWKPKQRVIITEDQSKLTRGYELLKDAIYVEINLSAKDITSYSVKLLDEFAVDKSKISVYIPE